MFKSDIKVTQNFARDLDKPYLIWQFGFMLKPSFTTALAVPKNISHLKNVQKWPKNEHLTSFTKSNSEKNPCDTLCT